jgi:hypothetical protein
LSGSQTRMKRTFHSTEPNYRALAKLYQKQSFVAEVSCRVWLPRHLHERPFLSFESTDLDRQQLELSSPEYDVVISIFDFDGELRTNLHATNMFVTNFVVSTQGAQQPPRITFQGEPARIVKSESLVPQTEGELNTEFVLYITHNSFLSPHTVIERSYTGEVKVKKLRVHKDSIGPFENVIFDRHYYEVKLNDGGVGVYDKLAVILRSKCPADDVALFETEIKPVVDDYLLLSSFAANQWTNIVAWQAYDNKYAVDGWYGNVQVDTNQDTSPHRQESCLIEYSPGFIPRPLGRKIIG